MDKSLTVIIPTLNNIEGVEYLRNYFKDKPYKIVVVDNSKKNLGFAGGVNKGAEGVKTKWMLILNDDIRFDKKITNNKSQITNEYQISNIKYQNTIEKLIKFAEANNLEAVSPVLINPNGKVENHGYKLLPIGRIELVKEIPRSKFQETNKSKNPNLKQKILNTKYEILNTNLDGLTAACLLIKTEVFKKLGGFDESFFAYLEDVDLFIRLKALDPRLRGDDNRSRGDDIRRGDDMGAFGIAYDVEVLHNHMTTSKTMGNFKARQDMINWWRLYFKHPKMFRFNLDFILERLRNISGYIKATFR